MKAKYGSGYSGGYLGMPFGFALHCLTLKSGGAKSLLTGCEKTLLSNGNAATVAGQVTGGDVRATGHRAIARTRQAWGVM